VAGRSIGVSQQVAKDTIYRVECMISCVSKKKRNAIQTKYRENSEDPRFKKL